MRTFLGIDVGSTNTKTSLTAVDEDEHVRELAVHSAPTPYDASHLIHLVEALVRRALADGHRPEAVGITSMAETGVPLDADHRPLSELIRWNGPPGQGSASSLEGLGRTALFEATGVQLHAKTPLAMWDVLRRTRPDVWARMARWAGVADLVGLSLTDRLVTDHTLAGRTMAYRLPDPTGPLPDAFDADLLASVDMRPSHLPLIVAPGDAAGSVSRAAARRTGLLHGTPVVIAGHDHAVAAWAGGVRHPGQQANSIGTTEALLHVLGTPVDRPLTARTGMSLTRSVAGDNESLLAGSANGGALIRWWLDTTSTPNADEVFADAERMDPSTSTTIVLPYLFGRQCPDPDPEANLEAFDARGEPVDLTRGDVPTTTRALIEGMVFHLRWMASAQRKIAPQEMTRSLTILGRAGPATELWTRVKAAVLPLPISTAGCEEPAATGAALLAGTRLGLLPVGVELPRTPVPPSDEPITALHHQKYLRFIHTATTPRGDPWHIQRHRTLT